MTEDQFMAMLTFVLLVGAVLFMVQR